jgi:amino acid adenylation domain-containing protein
MLIKESEKSSGNLFPISKIQEQFWVLGNLSPLDTTYNIPLIYRINGDLNINALIGALTSVLGNHDMLRASLELINNTPLFHVPSEFNINEFFDQERINSEYSKQLFNDYVLAEAHKPFNIKGDRLLRVRVFEFDDLTFLSIVFHHIIIDLHSKYVFINELASGYNNLVNSREIKNEVISRQYSIYSEWHDKWLRSEAAEKMREGWLKEFDLSIEQIDLPYQYPHKKPGNTIGKRMFFEILPELSNEIDAFSTTNNITPFVFHLTAYAIFLSRICNQDKIVIGVPFSNRRREEFADTIGCFVNILPVTLNFDPQISIYELIKQVRSALLSIHRKQEIPYMELNSALNRNSLNPLFRVGFTFEEPVELLLDGLEIESVIIEREGSQLDLFLTLWHSKINFCGFWEYNTVKFTAESILRFNETYKLIIKSMLENPSELTHGFNILSDTDSNFIDEFNNTTCDYERKICLHQKFEIQADKTPDSPAIITNIINLTYRETDEHINCLANYIISIGVQPGDVIAICCERGVEMIVGILAVLKSGACYLPLQIDNPPERNDEMIRDSNPKLILSTQAGEVNINNKGLIVFIDNLLESPLSRNSSRPCIHVESNSLAYILYTSGSTGKPKGSLIEHHSVINRIGWMQRNYLLNQGDAILQKTPITFDVSVWELFWWFFNGSRLVLLNVNGEKDPAAIIDYIEKYAITQIHFVPSMFSPFLHYIKQKNLSGNLKNLKNIFLSGEALTPMLVSEFYHLGKITDLPSIVNLYGPTEATVDVSYYNCPKEFNESDKIYIGKPIDNTKLYIVNKSHKVQPVGAKGELLITGVNLSRGYLNKQELTLKSFINFQEPGGEIVPAYRTGDLALLCVNSEIEYIGRIDNQVKIRGMRIEPGEIESKLSEHPKIMQAAVTVAFEGECKSIIGYVSFKSGTCLTPLELREYISTKVPSYMIPAQFIIVKSIPLTASGKLNRKALPEPDREIKSNDIIKPSLVFEAELLKLWQSVLDIQNISVTDNFFDIGGNSLLALKLVMNISEYFKTPITIVSVFEYTNIREFSRYLSELCDIKQDFITQKPPTAIEKRKNIIRKNRIYLN